MKIAKVDAIPLSIPFSHGGQPFGWGGQVWTRLSIVLVRVETVAENPLSIRCPHMLDPMTPVPIQPIFVVPGAIVTAAMIIRRFLGSRFLVLWTFLSRNRSISRPNREVTRPAARLR